LPELPEVEAVRRQLESVMTGARFDAVVLRRPDLRVPFPRRFKARLIDRTVVTLTRRAKYLLATLSSGETLVMHLGMTGSFEIGSAHDDTTDGAARASLDPHDHVVFRMSSGTVVTFNDPRRFGFMDLVPRAGLEAYPALRALGPEPLSAAFDAATLARACKGKKVSLKVALLDQRVVAGLGNIYASEALHRAGWSPRRRASTIATVSGLPRQAAHDLTIAVKQVLTEAVDRVSQASYRDARFRVYDREGEPCPTPGCRGIIKRFEQAGRSTFYCPVCQR
jgi:formamidopyrimidine-DNA glycosylase